jgi:ubiquinone/menaquinone biosynthesis C-methylase UbiE
MADYLTVVYGEGVRPYTEYPSKLVKYLFERFDMKEGMRLLEPGCGRGEFLRVFKGLGMDAVGLDRSEESRKLLGEDSIDLVVCDVESDVGLPFPDNSFDVIYNKSFMEHLSQPDVFLREAHRVLKPGGMILCLIPDWESNYKTYFDDFTHRTPFTKPSLEDIYKICDFEDISVIKFRQLPIVWKFPLLNYFCAAISPFISVRVENKFLRWSRELMLVGSAHKPVSKVK